MLLNLHIGRNRRKEPFFSTFLILGQSFAQCVDLYSADGFTGSQSFSIKILRTLLHCFLDFDSVEKSETRLEMGIFSYLGVTQFVLVAVAFILFVSYESLFYA